jgi:xanthine/CO dehydrogenase XdhC/CoxF family maturation factor
MPDDVMRLLPLVERERARGSAVAFAIVLATAGSTYRKPGACMVIARDGEFAGLLSGGCLEGDLVDHARGVIDSGRAQVVRYDMRGPDDQLFGLGSGCEGAMDVLLTRVGPHNGWEPFASYTRALIEDRALRCGVVTSAPTDPSEFGAIVIGEAAVPAGTIVTPLPFTMPPHVLVLGGGPDAVPIIDFTAILGWRVTVVDHRPAYATHARLARAHRALEARASTVDGLLDVHRFAAAIVMSHHLDTDAAWLRWLAGQPVPYVGLLGPAARRERLLHDLGAERAAFGERLRAPVGLDLGGGTPEAIALAIVAEIQAFLAGRTAGPMSEATA